MTRVVPGSQMELSAPFFTNADGLGILIEKEDSKFHSLIILTLSSDQVVVLIHLVDT